MDQRQKKELAVILEKGVEFIGMGESIRLLAARDTDKGEMSKAEFLRKLKEKRQKNLDGK